MNSREIRKRFIEFFKKRAHTEIPSASLVPQDDASVLFTTAGMQPLVPYLLGTPHPAGRRLVNVQKCVRTQDIEEVGDATHDTFFEMLGNWSLGDPNAADGVGEGYFKKEAIAWSYELLTDKKEGFGLDPKRLYITCFAGDADAPRDNESAEIWRSLGVPKHRIYFLPKENNWWSPGETGPCGPDSEMFYDITKDGLGDLSHDEFLAADDEQKVIEVWNDVFMEYEKRDGVIVGKLAQKNVDTGAGLERLATVLQEKDSIFETDLFAPVMREVEPLAEGVRARRIIADHVRTAIFMASDGVVPSNTDRGYVLRRLVRRALFATKEKQFNRESIERIIEGVVEVYGAQYPNIPEQSTRISDLLHEEMEKFSAMIDRGIKEFEKISKKGSVSGKEAFTLFTTFGFPVELTEELAGEHGVSVDVSGFKEAMEEHRRTSRKGAEQKFGGGLADHHPETVKLHTATHLVHAALREVLGEHVLQKGSNITQDRLRFDFSHPEKMTQEEIKRVEEIVNENIARGLSMRREVMSVGHAKETGTIGLFDDTYAQVGNQVSVYSAVDPKTNEIRSREICGGPHVAQTTELGHFRITKEESVARGIRRIKAVLEHSSARL